MGQSEVIDILEKEKRWMKATEIIKIHGGGASGVRRCLTVLANHGEIDRKYILKQKHHRVGELYYAVHEVSRMAKKSLS